MVGAEGGRKERGQGLTKGWGWGSGWWGGHDDTDRLMDTQAELASPIHRAYLAWSADSPS